MGKNSSTGPDISIEVSSVKNWRYEALVAIHELAEALLCYDRNITQAEVDRFDKKLEKNRKKGNDDEPGDDSKAPYKNEHCTATGIERIMAAALTVDWKKYEETLNELL
jgi:hypothetical protein